MDEVFVRDGQEVSVGTLLGYEGCSGSCTGDHVHIGLHEGNPEDGAQFGISVPVLYRTSKVAGSDDMGLVHSEDFVCGLGNDGYESDGEFYESYLPSVLWHPNGSLVKSPNSPHVYLVEDDELRHVLGEELFWSHGYDFEDVLLVSEDEINCYLQGQTVSQEGLIDSYRDSLGGLWLVVGSLDDSRRYRIQVENNFWEEVLRSWGMGYSSSDSIPVYDPDSQYEYLWPVRNGMAMFRDGSLVRERSSSTVYFISDGAAVPFFSWEVYLRMGYFSREIIWLDDGQLQQIHRIIGDCQGGFLCLNDLVTSRCGGGFDLSTEHDFGGEFSDEDNSSLYEDSDEVNEEWDGEGSEGEPVAFEDSENLPETDEEDENDSSDSVSESDSSESESTITSSSDKTETCEGEDVCIADLNLDGMNEALLMTSRQWLFDESMDEMAYVWANGGCFDGVLDAWDFVGPDESGYYIIDFSDLAVSCNSELSLISRYGIDGAEPENDMSNWLWWQNASFCRNGSYICHLMDNGTAWEEWLLSLEWDPFSGLFAHGNGFISNSQL